MSRKYVLAAAAMLLSAPMAPMAIAQDAGATGDAAAGERAFRQCIACHVVVNEAGDTLAGRNGRQGPNLYAISGRTIGSVEDFRYSDGLLALNEMGVVWEEENFAAYVQDPTGYIQEASGDSGYRGSMSFRVRSEDDALNLYAYLASLVAE